MQVLFGGTFDPIHDGHIAMIKALLAIFSGAQIHVIPNRQPPHRNSHEGSLHRLKMLEIAMQDMPDIVVNPVEINRLGPSYTVDTLQQFRLYFGRQESLVLCVGADVVENLERWHQATHLANLCHLCILSRLGEKGDLPMGAAVFTETDALEPLFNQPSGLHYHLRTPDVPISSTAVRRLIVEHRTVLPVPSEIADYIWQYHLYQDTK